MFFLRCAFWLMIVYASMSWAPGTFAPAAVSSNIIATSRSQVEALVTSSAARATDLCVRHASECITDAARLSALADVAGHDADAPEAAVRASIPLPVPDPRRRRDAKMGHAP